MTPAGPARLSSRALIGSVAAILITQAGCSTNRVEPSAEPAQADVVINPPRGSRGNPPFYEVLGQRYYVQNSSDGYRETGIASWYGEDFHGLPTSGGEIYDMHAMTAAHKTLPIPTWVEVTHMENGRRVIVKVNDRGPFVDNRLIDLSFSAAEALDLVGAGTAQVEVRARGAPAIGNVFQAEATPRGAPARPSNRFSTISEAAAATPGPDDQPMQQLYIQVGAFSQRGNASELLGTLQAAGYDRVFIESDEARSPPLHRVRIGPLAGVDEFDRVSARLASLGVNETHLVVEH